LQKAKWFGPVGCGRWTPSSLLLMLAMCLSKPSTIKVGMNIGNWEERYQINQSLWWCKAPFSAFENKRYIAMTSTNERLRLFAAGLIKLVRSHKGGLLPISNFYIRHNQVPLFECIAKAMEDRKHEGWVLLA